MNPYGFKKDIDERSSLEDLRGATSQHPMKCKRRNLVWEAGSLPWESVKEEHNGRHLHVDGWVWMMSKKLESYLQIYDTGQQEAWLRWLLLKEFGHHPLSKGMWVKKVWQDTCIIGQQGVWTHCVDMTFFISITMFSLHDLYDGGMRRQQ